MTQAFVSVCRVSFLGVPQVAPRPIFDAVFAIDPIKEERNTRAQTSMAIGEDAKRRWTFSVAAQIDRVDIVQQAILDPWADPANFTTLRPVAAVIGAFADRVLSRTAALPWVAPRIALGCVAQWSLPDQAAINAALVRLNPGLPIEAQDEEVQFRRNRPATLDVDGRSVRCNRIISWQSARSVVVTIGSQARPVVRQHMLVAETDCNSDQERSEALGPAAGERVLRLLADQTTLLLPNGIPT
jgi:hypothetical protein